MILIGGEEPPNCITAKSEATVSIIKNRLIILFGNDTQFADEMVKKNMKERMLEDLHYERKEEYMNEVGISILFCSHYPLLSCQ